jgi:Lrp/AsnC family leucine-responsive transcriptional regulator
MKLDALNTRILEMLRQNARISFVEMAKEIGLTPPAVADRVKKLEEMQLIEGYHAKISYLKSGYQLKAVVMLRAFVGKLKPFLTKVKSFNEVQNCYRITGNENIIMEVVFKDQLHMEKFIDVLITYGEVRTHIILSEVISNAKVKTKA